MKLVKEITEKRYQYDEDGKSSCFVEEIKQYHYENEKEKLSHSKQMQMDGFEDSGQVKTNIGDIFNPNHVWFGSYVRYNKE